MLLRDIALLLLLTASGSASPPALGILLLNAGLLSSAHRCPDLLSAAHAHTIGATAERGTGTPYALRLETLSVHPPVWRVASFLSAAECAALEEQAVASGTFGASGTSNDGIFDSIERGTAPPLEDFEHVRSMLTDHPASLNTRHVRDAFRTLLDMPRLGDDGAAQLLTALDTDGDGHVGPNEWRDTTSWGAAMRTAAAFRKEFPDAFARFSTQGWVKAPIDMDARVATLLGIPPVLLPPGDSNAHAPGQSNHPGIRSSVFGEPVQVLRYQEKGHYTCHHDSSPDEDAFLRRAFTVLVHLRDVPAEEGGGTWFPGAGADPRGVWDEHEWSAMETNCTLHNSCTPGGGRNGLLVPSVRGQAIVFQNHRRKSHPESGPWGVHNAEGWQPMDWSTLHAGCDVRPGTKVEKWVANQWVWKEAVEALCNIDGAVQQQQQQQQEEEEEEGEEEEENYSEDEIEDEKRRGSDDEDEDQAEARRDDL